jgi:hypothetical protein
MTQIVVELDEYELAHAAMAGCQRRIASIKRGRPQVYGAGERKNFWQIDIIGMMAEYAVAKAFDKHWQPATNQRLADLPGDVSDLQVRSTEHRDGHLFIHPDDKPAKYILAVVAERHVLLAGWCEKEHGSVLGVMKSPDTWWVSQDQLFGFDGWVVAWSDQVRARG